MSIRLVNTEVFERLAFDVIVHCWDGERVRYPTGDDEEVKQLKNHFCRLFRLNRLTYGYTYNKPVLIETIDLSFHCIHKRCGSVDVLKWVNAIVTNIDVRLISTKTDVLREDHNAVNFLKGLLWDAMHNYGIDPRGAYQLGLQDIPLYTGLY